MTLTPPSFVVPTVADGDLHRLTCPKCGESLVHLDDVYIAGRAREDEPIKQLHVDHRGHVDELTPFPMPPQGEGRRHTFAIGGWCESCGVRFAFTFQQHKGETFVACLVQEWVPAS